MRSGTKKKLTTRSILKVMFCVMDMDVVSSTLAFSIVFSMVEDVYGGW